MEDQGHRTTNKGPSGQQPPPGGHAIDPQEVKPPVPTSGVGKTGNPTIHETQGESGRQQPPPQPPVVVNGRPQPPQSDKWMTRLTAIIAVATAINVLVFWLESEDTSKQIVKLAEKAGGIVTAMNNALSDNRDAVTKAFEANREAVEAGQRQSKAALEASISQGKASMDAAQESFRIQERAWIALASSPELQPTKNGVIWTLRNFGNSPGFHIAAKAENVSKQSDISASQERICQEIETGQVWELLFPGLPGRPRAAFSAGAPIAYVVGCIKYRDQFSSSRWTKFCYQPDSRDPNSFISCLGYNSTDADENKKADR